MPRGHVIIASLALLAAAAGCSSNDGDSFGPEPDFQTIESRLRSPTGTLAAGKESETLERWLALKGSSNEIDVSGSSTSSDGTSSAASGVRSQALQLLDAGLSGDSRVRCADLQRGNAVGACACPSSGSFVYDFSGAQRLKRGGPVDVTLKVRFDGCGSRGIVVDGREFVKLRSSGGANAQDLFMILAIDVNVRRGESAHALGIDFLYDAGAYWASLQVDDGAIVVGAKSFDSATKSGTITIKDRHATWSCTLAGGVGTCTNAAGETRRVGG